MMRDHRVDEGLVKRLLVRQLLGAHGGEAAGGRLIADFRRDGLIASRVIRDPFYREIVERLGGRIDPELFERCAGDLLRDEWPTLVPVRGGTDAGMDSAVADGEGPA